MSQIQSYPIKAPLEVILGIWRIAIPVGHCGRARSTPGHLLHYVLRGRYRLSIQGVEYEAQQGDLIIYHDVEEVRVLDVPEAVEFISVAFQADQLKTVERKHRVQPASPAAASAMTSILALAEGGLQGATLALWPALSQVILEVYSEDLTQASNDEQALWWRIESWIRANGHWHPQISDLVDEFGVSESTISRAAKDSTGLPPMKRVAQLRMEHAKGLLRHSSLRISDIAAQLGYRRVHEFSREFAKHHEVSPRGFRQGN